MFINNSTKTTFPIMHIFTDFLVFLTFSLNNLVNCKPHKQYNILELAIIQGVKPDFTNAHGKNVTSSGGGSSEEISYSGIKKLESSPGCPRPFEGSPWVYYLSEDLSGPKCYLAGSQGPCSENQKLSPQTASYFGYCDCNCEQYHGYEVNPPRAYCIGETKSGSRRILAYDRNSDTCHILFEQGTCETGQWSVFGDDPNLGPICETRRCPFTKLPKLGKSTSSNHNQPFSFFDFKTGQCHVTGEECFPQDSNTNKEDDHFLKFSYQLDKNNWLPQCKMISLDQDFQDRLGIPDVRILDCNKNETFSTILKRCLPIFHKSGEVFLG